MAAFNASLTFSSAFLSVRRSVEQKRKHLYVFENKWMSNGEVCTEIEPLGIDLFHKELHPDISRMTNCMFYVTEQASGVWR